MSGRMAVRLRIAWPTGEAWPHECSICGLCGHNAHSHKDFMLIFPEVKNMHPRTWLWNEIWHACVFCMKTGYFKDRVAQLKRTRQLYARERRVAGSSAFDRPERMLELCLPCSPPREAARPTKRTRTQAPQLQPSDEAAPAVAEEPASEQRPGRPSDADATAASASE